MLHNSKTNEEVSLLIYCVVAVLIGIGLSLILSTYLLKYFGGEVKVSLESVIAIAGLTIGLVIAIIGAFITVRLARMSHEIQERQSFFLSKEQILEFMKVAQSKFGVISNALNLMEVNINKYHDVLENIFTPIRKADGLAHTYGEYGYDDQFDLLAIENRLELDATLSAYDMKRFEDGAKKELINIENQLGESYQILVNSIVSALDDVSFKQFLIWQNLNVHAFGNGEFSSLLSSSTQKYPHEQRFYQSYFEFLSDSSFAGYYAKYLREPLPHIRAQSNDEYIKSLVLNFYSYYKEPDYLDDNKRSFNKFLVSSNYILGRTFSITTGVWEYYTSPYIDFIISLLKLYPSKVELDNYFDESLIFANKTKENSILYTYSTNLYTSLPNLFHEFIKFNKLKDSKKDTTYKLPEIINGRRNLANPA